MAQRKVLQRLAVLPGHRGGTAHPTPLSHAPSSNPSSQGYGILAIAYFLHYDDPRVIFVGAAVSAIAVLGVGGVLFRRAWVIISVPTL
jgi:hypothetical protein